MKTYDIVIASDHAGFALKSKLIEYLIKKNLSALDLGSYNAEEKVDYPDYAHKVVEAVAEEKIAQLGILVCYTGVGMSIAANRNSEIRAALCRDAFTAERARAHNNANILILAAGSTDESSAIEILEAFLSGKFEGGRHSSRLSKIR